jgi:hypothetical protein
MHPSDDDANELVTIELDRISLTLHISREVICLLCVLFTACQALPILLARVSSLLICKKMAAKVCVFACQDSLPCNRSASGSALS